MCGRFALLAFDDRFRDALALERPPDPRLLVPRYNIAPTEPILVILAVPAGRELRPMRWGLLPGWVKDPTDFPLLFNARSETARQKPAFRAAYRRRRCLIPASGFYEWQTVKGRRGKQPFWIAPADGRTIAFGGLYETYSDASGGEIDTAAILTCRANETLAPLHDRMPVIIDAEDFEAWLSPGTPLDLVDMLCRPADKELFSTIAVSNRVNAVANDDAGLLQPVTGDADIGQGRSASNGIGAERPDDQGICFNVTAHGPD